MHKGGITERNVRVPHPFVAYPHRHKAATAGPAGQFQIIKPSVQPEETQAKRECRTLSYKCTL